MKKQLLIISMLSFIISCSLEKDTIPLINKETPLELVAETDMLWTGIAISKEGRIFVNFPRWSMNVPISVGEVVHGKVVPYPNESLNSWTFENHSDNKFVCVQSVYIDDQNYLWILDPASPLIQGVLGSGGRLHKVNLSTNSIVKTYKYDSTVLHKNSYLNDVRIDTKKSKAYITDSGVGSIIVTDLKTGESNRYLEGHFSVKAHFDFLNFGDNKIPLKVHSDGISLNNENTYLYYIPLTSHTLYRINTDYLNTNEDLYNRVEKVCNLDVATDGMIFDNDNNLFLGGLEDNSINVFTSNNDLLKLVKNENIKWADSFAKDAKGNIYFTTSQLHLPAEQKETYSIYKLNLKN